MATPEKALEDIRLSANNAKAHYQVWWVLVHEAVPRFVTTMNRFPEFFLLSSKAHFESMTSCVFHLFDKNRKSSSLHSYLRSDRSSFSDTEYNEIESKIDALASRAKSMTTIRHGCVAHTDLPLSREEIFSKASITPDQMRDLIDDCGALVEHLCARKGASPGATTQGVFSGPRLSKPTLSMLHALSTAKN